MITQELLNNVARHLSGRPGVIVRLREPVFDGSSGACYKTLKGSVIIDVNPGAQDILYTFLHECAHARYDLPKMTPSNVWKSAPGSLSMDKRLNALPRESKADKQAAVWGRYAVENCWRYFETDNVLEKQLLCLLDTVDPF
jgi:hypothetical protein